MSKDSFKVKKGLTLTPIDPADITNPQAGDLIADSTDDNKIKKYDATSSDWTAVGGSSGIGGNLMSDFEKLTPTETNVTSATDTVTFLPIDDNNKSIKATWAGSVGSIQYQVALDSSLQEIQGTVSVWLRTSLSDIQISSVQDGTKISTLAVTGNNKWKQYEIPMVLGGSNVGFIVESLTAQTGDVFIDQPFVGLTPSSYAFDVAQSEVVGTALMSQNTDCTFFTTSTSYAIPTSSGGCAPTITGSLTYPESNKPKIRIPNAKAGHYRVTYQGLLYNDNSLGYCNVTMSTSETLVEDQGISYILNASSGNRVVSTYVGDFYRDSAGDFDINIIMQSGGSASCSVYASDTYAGKWVVTYYPPKSTIVTQVQTLDASTANEFSIRVENNGSTASIKNQSGTNGIDSVTRIATGRVTLDYTSMGLTVPPAIVCDAEEGGHDSKVEAEPTTTSATIQVQVSGANNDGDFSCTISKLGTDYNKSAMIVGNFEQIKTTELCEIQAYGNSGDVLNASGTEDIPFEIITSEVGCVGAWDNSGNTDANTNDAFTPPRTGLYTISTSIRLASSSSIDLYLYENGVLYETMGTSQNASFSTINTFSKQVYLTAGNVYTFRIPQAFSVTLSQSDEQKFHKIVIKEVGDTASLIKNLNDNKTVKCQTKYLTASTATTGILSNLTFNNLTIGKRYQVIFSHSMIWTATGQAVSQVSISNGSQICNSLGGGQHNSGNGNFFVGCDRDFIASNSSLTFNLTASSSSTLYGDASNTSRTRVKVCELPDYYIDTDEW